jgi:hypothetical protein
LEHIDLIKEYINESSNNFIKNYNIIVDDLSTIVQLHKQKYMNDKNDHVYINNYTSSLEKIKVYEYVYKLLAKYNIDADLNPNNTDKLYDILNYDKITEYYLHTKNMVKIIKNNIKQTINESKQYLDNIDLNYLLECVEQIKTSFY